MAPRPRHAAQGKAAPAGKFGAAPTTDDTFLHRSTKYRVFIYYKQTQLLPRRRPVFPPPSLRAVPAMCHPRRTPRSTPRPSHRRRPAPPTPRPSLPSHHRTTVPSPSLVPSPQSNQPFLSQHTLHRRSPRFRCARPIRCGPWEGLVLSLNHGPPAAVARRKRFTDPTPPLPRPPPPSHHRC